MDLSNRVVIVKSTLTPEEEEHPPFSSDDLSILFGDIATPTGFVLNKGDPRECYLDFPEAGYIPEIFNLIEDPQWVGKTDASNTRKAKERDAPYSYQAIRGSSP